MIFCRGDTKSLTSIFNLLKKYALCSDHTCNTPKSHIYGGGMLYKHCKLAKIIGITRNSPLFFLPWSPFFIGKPKANRVLLVKTVIHIMMVHCISIYNFPASIIKRIDTWMRISFGVEIWRRRSWLQFLGKNVAKS